jgi:hypothetical protein
LLSCRLGACVFRWLGLARLQLSTPASTKLQRHDNLLLDSNVAYMCINVFILIPTRGLICMISRHGITMCFALLIGWP